jgi:hypothetical protein
VKREYSKCMQGLACIYPIDPVSSVRSVWRGFEQLNWGNRRVDLPAYIDHLRPRSFIFRTVLASRFWHESPKASTSCYFDNDAFWPVELFIERQGLKGVILTVWRRGVWVKRSEMELRIWVLQEPGWLGRVEETRFGARQNGNGHPSPLIPIWISNQHEHN